MRCVHIGIILAMLASPAAALDLGVHAPMKSATRVDAPPADPAVIAQGGDSDADAIFVDGIPILLTGTTVGYNDHFGDGDGSPDIVFGVVPTGNVLVDLDLLDSTFDTELSIYRENLTLVAHNDDFHPDGTSRLENIVLVDRMTYYVVVDGHAGAAGEFVLAIQHPRPCRIGFPEGVEQENEPPLVGGYVDAFNGDGDNVRSIEAWLFHGRSGWYVDQAGIASRDTDWFAVDLPKSGTLEIWGDAEQPTYLAVLGPRDDGGHDVLQSILIGPCAEGALTITGAPGSTAWLWVAPMRFEAPNNGGSEFAYILTREDYLVSMSATAEGWVRVRQLVR